MAFRLLYLFAIRVLAGWCCSAAACGVPKCATSLDLVFHAARWSSLMRAEDWTTLDQVAG